jgi:DNA polymerase III subunit gamma/tau
MASQSLYRKWRSQTFDEMVGQKPIIDTLRNALTTDNLKHAYLFTGPRGTGKTSTARLLAKTVNCTNSHNGEPCNECQQCREITAGNSFNVIEIDAASNRGIDSIRELREKVMVPPAAGKYKIYILDEAHMLTTESFNALLKTLEEPPEYAIFILATTEVHKLLPTVISRCQRLDFKRISTRQIVSHLLFVAQEEQVQVERGAAELIARTAAGGMRDALSLLDQAIAYAGNEIVLTQVQAMLGVADPRAISKLIAHIASLDSPALLYLIHELSEAGADLRQLNAQMVEYWRALMLAKAGADVAQILDLTEDEVHEVQQLLPSFALEELTECARIFTQNDLMQKSQGTPQLGLELASLECTELHRRAQSGQAIGRQSMLAPAQAATPTQTAVSRPATVAPPQAPVAHSAPSTLPNEPVRRDTEPVQPIESTRHESATERVSFAQETRMAPPTTSGYARLSLQQVQASWDNVKKRTMQKSHLLATYIGMSDAIAIEEGEDRVVVIVRVRKQNHYGIITKAENFPQDVDWALSTEFDLPCKVRLIAPEQGYTPPLTQQHGASYSVGTAPPQQSAYREPARQERGPASTENVPRGQPAQASVPNPSVAPKKQVPDTTETSKSVPLARPQGLRENKRVALSKEEAQQKAQQNPVVQDVLRTFRATIQNIQPK